MLALGKGDRVSARAAIEHDGVGICAAAKIVGRHHLSDALI